MIGPAELKTWSRTVAAKHDYTYNAWKPGVKEQVEIQTLNSSGIRDISRNLSASKNSAEVKTYFMDFLNGLPPYELEIEIMAEADELWSYVGRKQNQRWTWSAVERKSGMILAWHNGRRTDESCSCLIEKLSVFPVTRYHTDDWKSYRKYIPVSKHVIGKADTWQIERRNLNFRTHKNLSQNKLE